MSGVYRTNLPTLTDGEQTLNDYVDVNGRPVVVTSASTADKASMDAAAGTYPNASPYVLGTARASGKAVLAIITAAGNASMTFVNGQVVSVPLAIGLTVLPFGVTNIAAGAPAGNYYALS